MRRYSLIDRALLQVDLGLRTLFGRPRSTGRPLPVRICRTARWTRRSDATWRG